MSLRTRLTTVEELKACFLEELLNTTDKITKVSDTSVLNGLAYGVAKVGQKAVKEVAVVEAHLFADAAHGEHLDRVALMEGIAPRFGASGSSTYLRLVASPGTTYLAATHTVTGYHGVTFALEADVTVGSAGFTYAKVRSVGQGARTNVDPLSLTVMANAPAGHRYVINEYRADGGRDKEDDEQLRKRCYDGPNILARGTLAAIEQAFMKVNPAVLRVLYSGINAQGQSVLSLVSCNGMDFSETERGELLSRCSDFFSLVDLKPDGSTSYGVALRNVDWQPIDVSFRVELYPDYNPAEVRAEIALRVSKYMDYRFWAPGRRVEWDDLLQLVKGTPGVKYCLDQFFSPRVDLAVQRGKLPRVRGFLMLDPQGGVLTEQVGLNPFYYPSVADFSYQATVLQTL